MADGLILAGVTVSYDDDSMTVTGGAVRGGVNIASQHDHDHNVLPDTGDGG